MGSVVSLMIARFRESEDVIMRTMENQTYVLVTSNQSIRE
jgi:hypothetical protein